MPWCRPQGRGVVRSTERSSAVILNVFHVQFACLAVDEVRHDDGASLEHVLVDM